MTFFLSLLATIGSFLLLRYFGRWRTEGIAAFWSREASALGLRLNRSMFQNHIYGTVNGSENVNLLGSGFQPGKTSCAVRFGSKEAANVTIVSESKIQVTTPAGDPGPVDVMVTFDDGRTFKLGGGFNYKVPDQTKARDIFLSGGKVNVPGPQPKK